jgi:hypothetical protein
MNDEIIVEEPTYTVVDRLAGVPGRLARAVAGRGDADLQTGPGGESWSAGEILAHLRASDDIIGYRAYAILARDNPPLPAYDDRRWMAVTGYAELPFRESLAAFSLRRADLERLLRRATPADWQRVGTHELRGPLTLADLITELLEHEEEHCRQLEALWGQG